MKLTKEQNQEIKDLQSQNNKTKRVIAPKLEDILYEALPILDHGFIRVIDYMGNDNSIVQAARVSYGKGTKKVNTDSGLIKYLMRHWHSTPFEMCEIKYHVKLPIFIARQWIRHRTANVNEYSARYSILDKEFYLPTKENLAAQSTNNRQGRGEVISGNQAEKVLGLLKDDAERTYKNYEEMIEDDIARELARINLPLSTYTEWYWQMDLKNMFHFLKLRMDHHAQWEIQEYGRAMAQIVKAVCPLAYDSFERHMVNGARFSAHELHAIKEMLDGKPNPLEGRKLAEFNQKLDAND